MIKRLIICMAAIVVPMALWSSCLKPTVTIRLSDHIFEVPKGNLFSSGLSRFFEGLGTDKKTPEMHLIFSAKEMEKNVPGFSVSVPGYDKYYADDLTVLVSVETDQRVSEIEDGTFNKDLWRATGQFSPEVLGPRIVKYDDKVDLYRVYMEQIKRSWWFTSINPESIKSTDKIPSGNKVTAKCHETKSVEGMQYSCNSVHVKGNIRIEFTTPRTNFKYHNDIIEFVYGKLTEWTVEGSGSE